MGLRVVHNMLPGRLRVRADELRVDEGRLKIITQELGCLSGVGSVEGNSITGSILINYDINKCSESDILFLLSQKSGLLLDISETELQPINTSEFNGMDIPYLARAVEEPFRNLNSGLLRLTNGYMNLSYLIPVVLMGYGTSRLIRLGPVPAVPWYLLYWWSFRTFVLLNNNRIKRS